jgi:hypothetical protein
VHDSCYLPQQIAPTWDDCPGKRVLICRRWA